MKKIKCTKTGGNCGKPCKRALEREDDRKTKLEQLVFID